MEHTLVHVIQHSIIMHCYCCITGDNPISCPTHSTCVEGFIRASCQCNPGYNPTVRHGQLQCTGTHSSTSIIHNCMYIYILKMYTKL